MRRSAVTAAFAGVAALGVAAAVAPVAATPAPIERSGEFVALSYNVAGLPAPLSGSEPATNSVLISPKLNDYDLVLLQEDWANPHPVLDSLGLLAYHHDIVSEADHPYQSDPAPNPVGADVRQTPPLDSLGFDSLNRVGPALAADGLNRLSRFPFGPLERVMWDTCHGSLYMTVLEEALGALELDGPVAELLGEEVDGGATDCMAQKGFSVARTELAPGVEVDVYNLHGDAGGHANDIAARADNFDQLARFIAEHSDGRAIILGGDTNLKADPDRDDRSGDDEIWQRFLASTGLTDVCSLVCDTDEEDGHIDKFAVRSGGGVRVTPLSHRFERDAFRRDDGAPLSDHAALAVRFRWTTGAPPAEPTADVAAAPETSRPDVLPSTGVEMPLWFVVVGLGAAATIRSVRRPPPGGDRGSRGTARPGSW